MELIPTKAYHITVAGEITEIKPANGEDFKLEEVKSRVEGYIEVVNLNGNYRHACGDCQRSWGEDNVHRYRIQLSLFASTRK